MQTTDQSANPPAPDLDEFSAVVRNIVADELDKKSAEDSATAFTGAAAWLVNTSEKERVQLYDDPKYQMSEHDQKDFRKTIESYCNPNGHFQNHLRHMKGHPEQAKYIMPALLLGNAAQLQIQWIHALIRRVDGTQIGAQISSFLKRKLSLADMVLRKPDPRGNTFEGDAPWNDDTDDGDEQSPN
jgi:hypothetical protein